MEIEKLDVNLGYTFNVVADKAKRRAFKKNIIVEFDFNNIICQVSSDTNLKNLERDYSNAHLLGWEIIGHNCVDEYSKELKNEITTAKVLKKEYHDIQLEKLRKKETEDENSFDKLIKGIEFEIEDKEQYNYWKSKNTDPYGNVCFKYAEKWGRRLQLEMKGNYDLEELIRNFDLQPNFMGITGFQHSAAQSILRQSWFYGDELKIIWNKDIYL